MTDQTDEAGAESVSSSASCAQAERDQYVQWEPRGHGKMFGIGVLYAYHIERIPHDQKTEKVWGNFSLYREGVEKVWIGNYKTVAKAMDVGETIERGGGKPEQDQA